MIKLYYLNDITSNSEEARFKIQLELDQYGLVEENVVGFDDYDDVFSEAETSLAAGDFVILAVENSDYLRFKYDFITRLALTDEKNETIEALINASYIDIDEVDAAAHCAMPQNSEVYASADGLFSGYSVEMLNGLCTVLPLDFSRLSTVLEYYIGTYFDASRLPPEPQISQEEEPVELAIRPENEIKEAVSKMIYSLVQMDKTIAIANGEAATHVYNLYESIQGLSDVTSFVEIIDPPEEDEPEEKIEPDVFIPNEEVKYQPVVDENGNQIFDEEGQPVFEAVRVAVSAPEEKPAEEKVEAKPKENPADKTMRHAREARRNMHADFGAAISDVFSSKNEYGIMTYFVFLAVADKKGAKSYKVSVENENDVPGLLFHAINTMCAKICLKLDAVNAGVQSNEQQQQQAQQAQAAIQKKLNPALVALTAIIIIAAMLGGILLAYNLTKQPVQPSTDPTAPPITASSESITESTSEASTADNMIPIEPSASEVSAVSSTSTVASTSGTFTFYVFGYGHGVGLSQTGANYYAKQGWTYDQILANYYYGTTLMMGDSYPQSINYAGTNYQTRDFIAGALEGEMGGSYSMEALKAQAVAIYTFAKYYSYKLEASAMAYKPTPSQSCYSAADFAINNGLYIASGGEPALTPFHATSAGITTSYYNVWGGTALTYLAGGRPSYGDYEVDDFKSTVTMSSAELKQQIESADSTVTLTGDPATWLSILTHDAAVNENTGYVSTIRVGGKEFSGNEFRTKLMGSKLRSHCFTIQYTPNT